MATTRNAPGDHDLPDDQAKGHRKMSNTAPVLIAGGGIGGLATALGLAQRGIASMVLERSAELGEIGAGIQLGANAYRRCFLPLPLRAVGGRAAITGFSAGLTTSAAGAAAVVAAGLLVAPPGAVAPASTSI